MSYLGLPRLHFAGRFQADVSTINNDPAHFNDDTFKPSDQQFTTYKADGQPVPHGWWNPPGTAYWRFVDCVVTRAYYPDGQYCDNHYDDPLIGMALNEAHAQVGGKLVDLDPEQQMVSQIWGFQIDVGDFRMSNGFSGKFDVTGFADIWPRYKQGSPDSFFSAFYQSVISDIQWSEVIDSPILQALLEHSDYPDKLSIKFVVDGYHDDHTAGDFTFGRVVGTIGPYNILPDGEPEPKHFVPSRYLRPPDPANTSFNPAPCCLDDNNWLHLDLGNSLPTSAVGGPIDTSIGALSAVLVTPDGGHHELGLVQYQESARWYENTAGIQSFALQPEQVALIEQYRGHPKQPRVALVGWDGDEGTHRLIENEQGAFIRADEFVYRIEANDLSDAVTLYASHFGQPAAGAKITLKFNNAGVKSFELQDPSGVFTPVQGPPAAVPLHILQVDYDGQRYPLAEVDAKIAPRLERGEVIPVEQLIGQEKPVTVTISTNDYGKVKFSLRADAPNNPRGYIDGQVYGVGYDWLGYDTPDGNNPSNLINILVFDAYACDGPPTWERDVQPILQQYANLYPVMKHVLDLADLESVKAHAGALQLVFSRPVADPNYMPVTRDLSRPKRDMLLQWLKNLPKPTPDQAEPSLGRETIDKKYLTITTVEALQAALQIAIELEHSTLPPYLCALYSIKPGHNEEVAAIIRSVVIEEMLHMALACNLLIAIGGSPAINKPNFVPQYPGPLPGNVHPDLTVHLRKCSIEQIQTVFLTIEEPSITVYPVEHHQKTIGWFYDQIRQGFLYLHEQDFQLFDNPSAKQLDTWHHTGKMVVVEDLDSALRAIHEIVEQGEGASPLDPNDEYDELAHYYKFKEIVEGHKLKIKKGPDGKSIITYTGDRIPFDPEGVYNMQDDPDENKLSADSQARAQSRLFNRSYKNLLNALHETFNIPLDDPSETPKSCLERAIGLMFSLEIQAKTLMETPKMGDNPVTAGPSFQV